MSEATPENLQERLEDLFTGIFDTKNLRPPDRSKLARLYGVFPRGWAWEADGNGILIWCSSEVNALLGFSPAELIGRSILGLAHTTESAEKLQLALSAKRAIQNLKISGMSRDGKQLTLLLNAMLRVSGTPPYPRYRGVTQVLEVRERPTDTFVVGLPLAPDEIGVASVPTLAPTWGTFPGYSIDMDSIRSLGPVTEREIPKEVIVEGTTLSVPIIGQQDEAIGMVDFERNHEMAPWTENDKALVSAVSQQLALALQDVRSNELTQHALVEMRKADQLKSQFLANMSHELRTPLNSIIGFSRVILKGIDGPITETQEHDLNAIYNAGQHLLGLINNILDFSKIESGKMELSIIDLDLGEVIREVIATAMGLVEDKPIELLIDLPEDLPLVQADNIRTRQILLNLLSNAAKFTEDGHIGISARAELSGDKEVMRVSVFDTGYGIALEDQNKLFEPFSQVDTSPATQVSGTGLGLSICKHLVELQGGRIWLDSVPGTGSTFTFTIPLRVGALREAKTPVSPIILRVTADTELSEAEKGAFQEEGFNYQLESAVDHTIETTRSIQPHIILVDPTIPNGAGWNILINLKNSNETNQFPINTFSLDKEYKKGFDLGVGDYVTKPVDNHKLGSAVSHLIPHEHENLSALVIDNSEDELELMTSILAVVFQGKIQTATSGFEGLVAARQRTPDLVVLDLFMPNADGFRLLEALRVDARTRETPIILLLPEKLTETFLRQLTLWTNHSRQNANLGIETYVGSLREKLDRQSE
jgi:signal transduction histidine kinase/DNA-binding response OmpR family regulator